MVAALIPVLAEALTARMTEAGWSIDPAPLVLPDGLDLPTFRRRVDDEFTAQVEFGRVGRPWVTGDPPVKAAGWVLVGYEPAYRLAPVVLGRESCGEFAIGAGELLDPPRQLTVTM